MLSLVNTVLFSSGVNVFCEKIAPLFKKFFTQCLFFGKKYPKESGLQVYVQFSIFPLIQKSCAFNYIPLL